MLERIIRNVFRKFQEEVEKTIAYWWNPCTLVKIFAL